MGITSVVIDQREPEHVRSLTFGGVPVSTGLLDAGDVLLMCSDSHVLAIERKTASDLLGSLADGRLWSQLANLRNLTPWCYLALVGQVYPGPNGRCIVNGHESGWTWAAYTGALLSVQELGVHVLHVANDTEFEPAVIRLGNRDRSAVRVQPVRQATLVTDGEAILAALPGVGPERAHAVLEHCGSAACGLWYLTDDSRDTGNVPGVGIGTKRRVRQALGLPDEYYLGFVSKETEEPATMAVSKETVAA